MTPFPNPTLVFSPEPPVGPGVYLFIGVWDIRGATLRTTGGPEVVLLTRRPSGELFSIGARESCDLARAVGQWAFLAPLENSPLRQAWRLAKGQVRRALLEECAKRIWTTSKDTGSTLWGIAHLEGIIPWVHGEAERREIVQALIDTGVIVPAPVSGWWRLSDETEAVFRASAPPGS